MPLSSSYLHRPDRTVLGTWHATALLVVPPLVWIGSLAMSWLIQDFTCTAARTAGAAVPGNTLFWVLIVLNVVMLAIIVACGLDSLRTLRQARRTEAPLMSFVGYAGVGLAALFGFGVTLIGITPLLFDIC